MPVGGDAHLVCGAFSTKILIMNRIVKLHISTRKIGFIFFKIQRKAYKHFVDRNCDCGL